MIYLLCSDVGDVIIEHTHFFALKRLWQVCKATKARITFKDLMKALEKMESESIHVKQFGHPPELAFLCHAAMSGLINALEYGLETGKYEAVQQWANTINRKCWYYHILELMAMFHHVHCLQWHHDHGFHWNNKLMIEYAIAGLQRDTAGPDVHTKMLATVKWFRDHGYEWGPNVRKYHRLWHNIPEWRMKHL